MNNIEEKKKGNGLLVVVIILLVVLIGLVGFSVYQNYQLKDKDLQDVENTDKTDEDNLSSENNNNNQTNLENELVEISTFEAELLNYDDLYKSIFPAYYNLYGASTSDINYGFYFHNANLRVVEDIPNKIKLSVVANYVLENYNEYFNGNVAIVPERILRDTYYNIFGIDGYYFEELEDCPALTKEYAGLTDGEVLFPLCGDTGLPAIETEIIKYEKNLSNSELYIYEVAGFLTFTGEMGSNSGDLFNLYKDYSRNELVAQNLEYRSSDEFDLLVYKDKLDIYKYTFKCKDSVDSEINWQDYYFYSVEKVK